MKAEEKLVCLTDKLALKEKALADCVGKKAGIKRLEKRLKAEVSALKEEVRAARLEELGNFLQQSGVAFEDIREAVNSGLFDKPEPKADSEPTKQSDVGNVSPVTRKGEEDEISGS